MSGFIRTASWILCVVYSTIPGFWLLVHHRAAFWRTRRRSPYRILMPAWIAMWIVIAVITAPFRHIALYHSPWPWIPALALVAAGFYLYLRSSRDFSGHQLTGVPEIRSRASEQTLVTAGIRQRVRHPVYLGHLCELLGWSLGTGLAVNFALTAFAIITGAFMLRAEDGELEQRFGAAYVAYRKQVPLILPRRSI